MNVDPSSDAGGDAALVAAFVASRDARAFAALYARHGAFVFRVAWRAVGGDDADAHDAAQEAWLRAVAALPGFAGRSALRTWLAGIALNCAREIVRKRAKHAATAERSATLGRGERASLAADDRVALEHALAALPDGARTVLVLHDVEGLTHEEVGTVLGIDAGTSKSQLSRARALLRAQLAPPEESKP